MVHDLRYAAAFNDGNERIFDDIGCMLSTVTAEGHEPKAMWVMDYQRYAWLDAHHAVFVYAPKLGTPRNYGFIAIGSIEAAQRLARSTDGQVLDGWDQVVAFFKARV